MGHRRGQVAALGLTVLLGACHAALPLSRGPAADAAQVDAPVISADAALPDQTTPDQATPDLQPPDLGPPAYFENFDIGPGAVVLASSTCTVANGKLSQQDKAVLGVCGTLYPPYADYRVEVLVTVVELKPDPLGWIWQGAGIGVRVQDPSSPPAEVKPGLYACILSPDGTSLSIARCEPQETLCDELAFLSTPVSLKTPYTLRATVTGDMLSCEVPGQVGPLTWQLATDHAQGAVSLLTLAASADFDDLRVDPL